MHANIFLMKNPGRIITEDDLASLVGQAWPLALTPSNIMSGFCKSGIYPLNPGRITDRHKAPSVIYLSSDQSMDASSQSSSSVSEPPPPQQSVPSVSSQSLCNSSIDSLLVLPKPVHSKRRRRTGLTTTTQITTQSPFLKRLREKKAMREQQSKKTAKKTNAKKQKSTPKPKSKLKPKPRIRSPKKAYNTRKKTASACLLAQTQQAKDAIQSSDTTVSSEDDEVPCGECGIIYGTDDKVWIQCECSQWFHISCVGIGEKSIPDVFLCPDCE